MTIDDLRKKYAFMANMTQQDIQRLIIFIMGATMEMGFKREEGEKGQLETLLYDVKDAT